jgi:integrase
MTRTASGHDYRPNIDPAYWEAIRDFVRETVSACEGHVPYPVSELYRAATEFSLWGWQSAGLPLAVDGLFERSIVAYYVQVGCGHLTAAARGNRRSILLRMTEHLTNVGPTRLPPLPPSEPSEPYTRRHVVSVMSWARAQSTVERRTSAHVLVCLGLGAGLAAGEIILIRNGDIRRSARDITIDVKSGRIREVPMLREFADLFPDERQMSAEAYAFRPGRTMAYVNAISNFIARGSDNGIRPQTQRMRATWIVRHLEARTPLSVLIRAAGLESLDALARFEHFAPPVDAEAADRFLRFAGDRPA